MSRAQLGRGAAIDIGGLTLANRIVMASMTRYFSPGGVPTEAVAQYYARRAAWA